MHFRSQLRTIYIASHNPVKVRATLNGFQRMFPGETFDVELLTAESGVSPQPRSNTETLSGATNRALAARQSVSFASFSIGIEGGIDEIDGQMAAFAWVVVTDGQLTGKGRTGTFFLPEAVARLVRQGMELGEADDSVFQRENSKQESGAIGLLTGNVIDRTRLYEEAVVMALIPFKNPHLYPPTSQEKPETNHDRPED